jgi:hypothetical protein
MIAARSSPHPWVYSEGIASERSDSAFNGVRSARKTDRVVFCVNAIFEYLRYETSDGPLPLGIISQIIGHYARGAGISDEANVNRASIANNAAMLATKSAMIAPNIAQLEALPLSNSACWLTH